MKISFEITLDEDQVTELATVEMIVEDITGAIIGALSETNPNLQKVLDFDIHHSIGK